MTMFRRGLDDRFVHELNREYVRGGWLAALFDDTDLFVAIRDGYVSVYHLGQSLVKLSFDGAALVGETHYKYLVRDDVAPQSVRSVNGRLALHPSSGAYLTSTLDDLAAIKSAARRHAGEEKKGVERILRSNRDVIDVEIAVSHDAVAKRIDLAAVRATSSGAEIMFVEAKLFGNPELRAAGTTRPAVLDQIARYEALLKRYEAEVRSSYLRVCQNLLELKGAAIARRRDAATAVVGAGAALGVSSEPRLAIYGFDEDQKKGAVWAAHRDKLSAVLGERLLLRGSADGFVKGISA